MEENNNIIFEYKTKQREIFLYTSFFIFEIFFMMFIYLLSAMFFMKYPLLSLVEYSYILWIFVLVFWILLFIINSIKFSNKVIFKTSKIKILNKYIKKACVEINYEDIEYFTIQNIMKNIFIKTNKNSYVLFCGKEYQEKINEILHSKVSDLSMSDKKQQNMERTDKPLNLFLVMLIGSIFIFFFLPIFSFFYTKIADYNLNKFIKSNYTDVKSLNDARYYYFSTMNNRAYYNFKQVLKIDKYTNNKSLKENAEYINELFPSRIEETQAILNAETIVF